MFFGEGRIEKVQRMILADNEKDRRAALAELLPLQRGDFYGVLKAMHGEPVTIRTIDPPLHEFLPKREDLMVEIAKLEATGGDAAELAGEAARCCTRVEQLHEFNPMLGHRGVRLGITYPEITEMQARAIFEAACQLAKEGLKVAPEVMIPLVGLVKELRDQKAIVDRVAAEVMKEQGVKIKYLVGTMIEVPRGALTADEIASEAQFFSFGTNDLTQMTFGFSRDDIGKFLGIYQEREDPRSRPVPVHRHGRRRASSWRWRCEKGRKTRPDIKLGVCGEHGGDPSSIHFFHKVGLNYVSALAVPRAGGAAGGGARGAVGEGGRLETRDSGCDSAIACPRQNLRRAGRAVGPAPARRSSVPRCTTGRQPWSPSSSIATARPTAGRARRSRLAGRGQRRRRVGRPRGADARGGAAPRRRRSSSTNWPSRTRSRRSHHPKVEAYDGYLYVILHGIDFQASQHEFATHDADFFVGPNYLVTVTDGHVAVDSGDAGALRNGIRGLMAEGPMALHAPHRRHDGGSLPARRWTSWRSGIDELEETVFETGGDARDQPGDPRPETGCRLAAPHHPSAARRARPAGRREFPQISRGDRLPVPRRLRSRRPHRRRCARCSTTGSPAILEAHLSNVSNRLNEVMKVLTIFSVIFMPMTVLTGHVRHERAARALPRRRARPVLVDPRHHGRPCPACMLWFFRRSRWI